MLDRVVEIREDILNQLKNDGVEFPEKIVDMMVDEFGERLESHEAEKGKELDRNSKTYKRILTQAIRNVVKRVGKIDFSQNVEATEDDYSEESTADFSLKR